MNYKVLNKILLCFLLLIIFIAVMLYSALAQRVAVHVNGNTGMSINSQPKVYASMEGGIAIGHLYAQYNQNIMSPQDIYLGLKAGFFVKIGEQYGLDYKCRHLFVSMGADRIFGGYEVQKIGTWIGAFNITYYPNNNSVLGWQIKSLGRSICAGIVIGGIIN